MIKYPFKNLVFQGGGIKTLTYHGALQVLEEMDVLPQIERVAGASAGATVALLVSLRFRAQDIIHMLRSVDYSKIPGTRTAELPEWMRLIPLPEEQISWVMQRMDTLSRLYRNYGWYAHDYAYQWLMEVIAQACEGNGRATFQEFRARGFRASSRRARTRRWCTTLRSGSASPKTPQRAGPSSRRVHASASRGPSSP